MKEGEVASIKVSLDEVTKSQWCFMHESCDDHEEEQEEKFMPVLLNAHKKNYEVLDFLNAVNQKKMWLKRFLNANRL